MRREWLVGGTALLLAAAVALWRLAALRSVASADAGPGGADPPASKSIAVLPLANVGDSASDYFAAGMTDEIATTLGRIPGLRIASRTSTRALLGRANATIAQIGKALRVSAVLEGTVRRDGLRVRVLANLISVADGSSLWSDSFDGTVTDVFRVQDSVASAIAKRLEITLGGSAKAAVAVHGTRSVAAQDFFWQAQYAGARVSARDQRTAIALYDSALTRDPRFADAWAGKAYSWFILADDFLPPNEAYPQAEFAVKKALEIDPASATAHSNYGLIVWWYRWDADAGEREILRAVTLSPQSVGALVNYGTLLGHTKRSTAAIDQLQRALRLDSLSANPNNQLALGFLYAGRFAEALAQAQHTAELFPATGTSTLGKAFRALGRYPEALAAFRRANELGYRTARGEEGITLAMAGQRDQALAIAHELERERQASYVAADLIARIYLCAGRLGDGFRWLDTAFTERSGYLTQLDVKQEYEPFHADPRFIALKQRVQAVAAPARR